MTALIDLQSELQAVCRNVIVKLETSGATIFVTIESEGHRHDWLTGDGDDCEWQSWILDEAYAVLAELKSRGYKRVPFSGAINMGHSGVGCFFAVEPNSEAM